MICVLSRHLGHGVSLAALVLAFPVTSGFAQTDQETPPVVDESGATHLDPITITARKRPELDLDVPPVGTGNDNVSADRPSQSGGEEQSAADHPFGFRLLASTVAH